MGRDQAKWKAGRGAFSLRGAAAECGEPLPAYPLLLSQPWGLGERGAEEGEPFFICVGLEGCGETDGDSRGPGVKECGGGPAAKAS